MENAPQPRNLLEEPMTTVVAMAEVEGPGWMEKQEAMEKGVVSDGEWEHSLANALERLAEGKPTVVNGGHGWHRWNVEADGSVSFSRRQAEILTPEEYSGQQAGKPRFEETIEKVRALGFVIVP